MPRTLRFSSLFVPARSVWTQLGLSSSSLFVRPSPSTVSCASASDRTFDFLGGRRRGAEEATNDGGANPNATHGAPGQAILSQGWQGPRPEEQERDRSARHLIAIGENSD